MGHRGVKCHDKSSEVCGWVNAILLAPNGITFLQPPLLFGPYHQAQRKEEALHHVMGGKS